ncbi:MAG: redox-regulated ATPase YchF [Patescibacteria group bacterium]
MSLSVGIVGLPNAGKSTLFNALAARRLSPTAAYPFTTIEPHEAVVPVPDENLTKLSELIKPEKTTPATVTFIDIAGLVKGAAQGEGLGNQFLAKIREVDAIVHVVRAFADENVPHPHGQINPKEDIEIVNLELELGGISGKPTLYVVNTGESQLGQSPETVVKVKEATGSSAVIVIAAKLEEELTDLAQNERQDYLKSLGIRESGLEKLIAEAYKLLNLITFYTIKGGREVRSWSLKQGATALDAAAKVHTDFAQHFVKAEVTSCAELLSLGSWQKAHEAGKIRLEGRDYVVQDKDVIEFKEGK